MISNTSIIQSCNFTFDWSSVIPTSAFIVSIVALLTSHSNAKKNIRLSIQQAIFNTISEKARDCNSLWEDEAERNYINATHFKVISELIITTEIIE